MSTHYSAYPNVRMQRLRRSATLRRLVRETRLSVD
ncbi:MAG: porphobilinogen synthase, partial [Gammaproteobacteria bacterium]|nr:porphobilinogen synthase [Gammaproteobacteria bacterium]